MQLRGFQAKENTQPSKASPKSIRLDSGAQLARAIEILGGPLQGVYIVEEGDQLWQIAARAGIPLEKLRALNGLGPLSMIKVGQRLNLTVK